MNGLRYFLVSLGSIEELKLAIYDSLHFIVVTLPTSLLLFQNMPQKHVGEHSNKFTSFPLGLPDIANKNTGCPVKLEFQINHK